MLKDYDMSFHYHQGKSNVVADSLSQLSMGSVSHIDDEKKELVKEVHQLTRLGVRLVDTSTTGGVSVHSSSESPFIVYIKAKQHLDPVLMELNGSVLSKLNESFSLGKM